MPPPSSSWLGLTHPSDCAGDAFQLRTWPQRWKSEQLKVAIDVTRRHVNVWLGTPDERNILGRVTGCDRIGWVPNPMGCAELPAVTYRSNRNSVRTVALAGRVDSVKNFAHQLAACALMRPVDVALVFRDPHRLGIASLLSAFNLPARLMPFMPRHEWLAFLRDDVDLVMQVSHTESFNYVGLEALCMGVPVVGSTALRYLPQQWQADPDSPDDIAAIARHLLQDPLSAHEHALKTGNRYAAQMDQAYLDWLCSSLT